MIMQETKETRELVSALTDGQLCGDDFARAVAWVGQEPDARLTWHAYHLVGDVLRSGATMAGTRDAVFMERLKLRLQQEPGRSTSRIAADSIAGSSITTPDKTVNRSNDSGANDGRFRWKFLAGLAALALVTVVGWQSVGTLGEQSGTPQLAQAQGLTGRPELALRQLAAGGEPQYMIRDPQLDALLAAHKQFGGTSALQMPAGFLRNATFDGATR